MIVKWLQKRRLDKIHSRRLEQLKKNPHVRVDSKHMTEQEKMDQGFNGNTYSINGKDVDF